MASSFKCVGFEPIVKGGLVARCRLEMPSGIILTCNVLRRRSNPTECFVVPVAEKLHGGGFGDLVTFVSDAVRQRWSEMALAAVKPYLETALASTPSHSREEAPF